MRLDSSRSMWFCSVISELARGDRNSCGHSTCKWPKLHHWPFYLPHMRILFSFMDPFLNCLKAVWWRLISRFRNEIVAGVLHSNSVNIYWIFTVHWTTYGLYPWRYKRCKTVVKGNSEARSQGFELQFLPFSGVCLQATIFYVLHFPHL